MKNHQYHFDKSYSMEPETYNSLPDFVRKKFSVIYDHRYKRFENIFIFKSSNEKWGVLKYDTKSQKYITIVENVYDSTGFYPQYKIILAVDYTDGLYSGKNVYILFDTEGRIIKKLENIDYISFDHFGNVLFSKNDLYGLFNHYFEESISCKYKAFTSLEKNLFLAKEQHNSDQLLINEKQEIIYNFGFSEIIYKHLHNNKIIIKESEIYYLLNINSLEKHKLNYDLIYLITILYDLSLFPAKKFITVTDYIVNEDEFDDIIPDKFMTDNGKYGLIDADGEICLPSIYDKIQQIHDDHFKVALGKFSFEINEVKDEITATNGKWGIINSKNEIIVPIKYTNVFFDKQRNSYSAYEGGQMIGYDNLHDDNYLWYVKGGKEIKYKI